MKRAKTKRTTEQTEITAVDKVSGNSDLLTKILNLLPPKPLVRSKAVSNHWFSLISDPNFLLDYSSRLYASQPPSSFSQFYHGTTPISLDGSDEFIPNIDRLEGIRQNVTTNKKLEILHSCNGLMLCYRGFGTPMLVVNPTTNKHRIIPHPCDFFNPNFATFLAFDPSISIHYKVVSFRYPQFHKGDDHPGDNFVIYIFASECGSWKEICLPGPPDWSHFSMRSVFWRGAIHWINCSNLHMQFHIEEEKFTWNQMTVDPDTLPEGIEIEYYIVRCDNGLLAIKLYRDEGSLEFYQDGVLTIFEMGKDTNFWEKKDEVDLKPLLAGFPDTDHFLVNLTTLELEFQVLYVRIEANEETLSLVLAIPGNIILYSVKLENNEFTAKVLKEESCFEESMCDFHPYIQCLVPV